MTVLNDNERLVSIGIDAAVVADHQVAIRGPGVREDFRVAPTLAGMAKLTERLGPYAGSLVVVEPTAGTWLPLTMAVTEAGCRIGFVQNRDSARLRQGLGVGIPCVLQLIHPVCRKEFCHYRYLRGLSRVGVAGSYATAPSKHSASKTYPQSSLYRVAGDLFAFLDHTGSLTQRPAKACIMRDLAAF